MTADAWCPQCGGMGQLVDGEGQDTTFTACWLCRGTRVRGVVILPPALTWERDALLDSWTAKSPLGTYRCIRTAFDSAQLWLGDALLRQSCADGSHAGSRAAAEAHYAAHVRGDSAQGQLPA